MTTRAAAVLRRWGGVAVMVVVAFWLGWWASRQVLESPPDPLGEPAAVTWTVLAGTVGREVPLTATARWPTADAPALAQGGTITSIEASADGAITAGDTLLTVDLQPVVVAQGVVPAFRDLRTGVNGPDVAQLQTLLQDLGIRQENPDGIFGSATRQQVETWQTETGVEATGVVALGRVLFLPELPSRVRLADVVVVGAKLTGGEVVVSYVTGMPAFEIVLAADQRGLASAGTPVDIQHDGGRWSAEVAAVEEVPETGQVRLVLSGVGGRPVCDSGCRAVPIGPATDFVAWVTVVEEVSGPALPIAAVHTAPDGTTFVRTPGGEQIPVTVRGAADGLAVVDGLEVGDVVELLSDAGL